MAAKGGGYEDLSPEPRLRVGPGDRLEASISTAARHRYPLRIFVTGTAGERAPVLYAPYKRRASTSPRRNATAV
jgi:hypothetical protein